MKSAITPLLRFEIVEDIKDDMFPVGANTYIGIGRPIRWGDAVDPESEDEIESVVYTTDYRNQIYRDLIAIKKVAAADLAFVVPRVDWLSGTTYDEYTDSVEMFSFTDKLSIGTANASGNVVTANTAVFTGNISTGNIVSSSSLFLLSSSAITIFFLVPITKCLSSQSPGEFFNEAFLRGSRASATRRHVKLCLSSFNVFGSNFSKIAILKS